MFKGSELPSDFQTGDFQIKNKGKELKCEIISQILLTDGVLINRVISGILIIILLVPTCLAVITGFHHEMLVSRKQLKDVLRQFIIYIP